MKTTRKRITEEDFKQMKLLQSYGLKAKATASISQRSTSTVCRVYLYDSYAEYRTALSEYNQLHGTAAAKSELPPAINEADNDVSSQPEPLIQSAVSTDDTLIALNRIADAIERLETAWTNAPKRKSIF